MEAGTLIPIKNLCRFESLKNKLIMMKLKDFQPNIYFEMKTGHYTIKTASTPDELLEVLTLRHEIFIRELRGRSAFMGVDFDKYDLMGDHILLIDDRSRKVVGTYRLNCSTFTYDFYSSNEFTLEKFLNSPGVKLELGRACIHSDYRRGAELSLIWQGLARYITLVEADYLFGCATVRTTCYRTAMGLYAYLSNEHVVNEYNIVPQPEYELSPKEFSKSSEFENIARMIPNLLKSYLKAGAKIHSVPAIDRAFSCTDLLTILKINELHPGYHKRYFTNKDR